MSPEPITPARRQTGRGESRLVRLAGDPSGLTIVEVLVAALILTVGSLAVFTVVDAATKTSYRSEQAQVVNNVLEQEMEQIRSLPYDDIAMVSAPSPATDINDPRSRVVGAGFLAEEGRGIASFVLPGDPIPQTNKFVGPGTVNPGPDDFQVGDVRGQVHRFVTWEEDPGCQPSDCKALKRITVAATVDSASDSDRRYREMTAIISDDDLVAPVPEGDPPNGPGPGDPPTDPGDDDDGDDDDDTGGGPSEPDYPLLSFRLTDTTCANNNAQRQPVTGPHAVHNTLGSCEPRPGGLLGQLLGAILGGILGDLHSMPPDLMLPKGSTPAPSAGEPMVDYSNNVSPTGPGLTLQPPAQGLTGSLGCLGQVQGLLGPVAQLQYGLLGAVTGALLPDSLLGGVVGSNPHRRIHKWVTPPLPTNLTLLKSIRSELNIWTKTANGQVHPGGICVWMFRRTLDANNVPVDVPILSLQGLVHTSYSRNDWPNQWTKITVQLPNLELLTIPLNSRIGIALGVDASKTSANQALQFMYDHHGYDSSLDFQTENVPPPLLAWY